jgi:hypothetical protein
LILSKKEKKIVSYRRYDNFDIFYNYLKKKFPYLIIPKLPSKNALSKIINQDNKFYDERRTQLKYFINYLHYHPVIGASDELKRFINGLEFDDSYFKKHTEYDSILEFVNTGYYPISNKIIGVFSNFFKKEERYDSNDQEEQAIIVLYKHYKRLYDHYTELKIQMVRL